MANHKSAEKRHRQNIKRRDHNRNTRAAVRTTVKSVHSALEEGNREEALQRAKVASSLLDKAVVHGLVHKNNAARRISRLYRLVNAGSS